MAELGSTKIYGNQTVTGDQNVLGDISVEGTVDGRDVAADGTKLDSIATGANNYVHPTYSGDDINLDTGALTGATVVSDIDINVTTDTNGHVTDANASVATRTLTPANIGALPLTGGTLTGDIIINKTGSAGITINADTDNVTETDLPFVKLTQDGGIGQLTFGIDNNNPYIYPNRTDNTDQNNDTNQLHIKQKDGSFGKVWHSKNDGSGSGLDADTLDGVQASGFATASHTHEGTTIDATGVTDGYVLTADGSGNSVWEEAAGGGAVGGGTDKIFMENGQTVTTSYTITSGCNALTAGDITINTGVTVTVPSGSRWVIV